MLCLSLITELTASGPSSHLGVGVKRYNPNSNGFCYIGGCRMPQSIEEVGFS